MRTDSRRRLARVLAATVVVAAPLAVTTGVVASATACASGNVKPGPDGWLRIAAPHFTTGGGLTGFAVARFHSDLIYGTNGKQVARSRDGGCTWATVFTVPDAPSAQARFSSATATISSIVTTATSRVYLVVSDVGRPHVVVSSDEGSHWRTSDVGLVETSAGTAAPSLTTAGSPGLLYLLVHGAQVAGQSVGTDVLFVSTDDGQSWSPQLLGEVSLLSSSGPPTFRSLSVDPGDPNGLWAGTSTGLQRSSDGGQSWETVQIGGADPMGAVDVAHDPGGKPRIITFESGQGTGYLTHDGGDSWAAFDTPEVADAVVTGADSRDIALEADGEIYQLARNALRWTSISDGLPSIEGLASDGQQKGSIYACSCGEATPALWRHATLPSQVDEFRQRHHSANPPPSKEDGQCMPTAQPAPKARKWGDPALSPSSQQIVMTPGSSRKVHYVFHQPPEQMDLFLATTTGPKSEFSHCPFKFGTVGMLNALVRERNVRAGVGDVGDYPNYTNLSGLDIALGLGDGSSNFVYKLERRLGAVDQDLYNRISSQKDFWDGGGPSGDQGTLAALFQAATGVGQIVGPPVAPTYKIAGGLQAGYDDYAYKVIVDIAGSYFNTPSRSAGYPGPEFGTTEAALRDRGIHHLGIWINNRLNKADAGNEPYDGRQDLMRVSRATGAISPKTMDCDGDGFTDLHAGDPLVCTYIAPAEGDFESRDPTLGREVKRMLLVLRDPQPVSVLPLTGADSVEAISPRHLGTVDALLGHTFDFDVTYRCNARDVNQTKSVRIGARLGSRVLAEASATLVCGAPPVPPVQHSVALPPVPPVPPSVPQAPNPGPVQVPAANPAPNPAPNPAQAPQAQAQPVAHPAAVPQMQEEPQLALQRASRELQADQPMSALTEAPAGDGLATAKRLVTYGGAFLLFCSMGLSRRFAFARAERKTMR